MATKTTKAGMNTDLVLGINQIARLIAANGGDKTYLVQGPMGSGKSSVMEVLKERFGDKYHYVTVDCTQLDIGDLQVPDVDKVAGVVRYVPNEMFVGDGTKPVIINFDELGKAPRPVQNAILPILLERRIGNRKLPVGDDGTKSIVFATTNLGAENVGDLIQPHARNRISVVKMRNPTSEEWVEWAMNHNVPASVCAWVHMNPDVFRPFTEVPDPQEESDFPYGFHPKFQRESFLTGRSLYLASIDLREDRMREVGDRDATMAGVIGSIGARAAYDLNAFIVLGDRMPAWETIVMTPDQALVATDSPAAMVLTMFSCIARCDKANFTAVMRYIKRMPKEIQFMFARRIMAVKDKAPWVAMNMEFTTWVRENHWVIQ